MTPYLKNIQEDELPTQTIPHPKKPVVFDVSSVIGLCLISAVLGGVITFFTTIGLILSLTK